MLLFVGRVLETLLATLNIFTARLTANLKFKARQRFKTKLALQIVQQRRNAKLRKISRIFRLEQRFSESTWSSGHTGLLAFGDRKSVV